MSRKSRTVDIRANETHTVAMCGGQWLASKWQVGKVWYVANPGQSPSMFDNEADAAQHLMSVSVTLTSAAIRGGESR